MNPFRLKKRRRIRTLASFFQKKKILWQDEYYLPKRASSHPHFFPLPPSGNLGK
jgi:hypothetical protein